MRRAAAQAWTRKALWVECPNPKQFFNKKRLARRNADDLYKGFRLRFVEDGVFLTRRGIVLSPEQCATLFTESFAGDGLRAVVVKYKKSFWSGNNEY